MNKRGQFYIITAIIFIAVIFSLVAISNYIKPNPSPDKFYQAAENYFYEVSRVFDYSLSEDPSNLADKVDEFTTDFITYGTNIDPKMELIYIYGNEKKVVVMNYAEEKRQIDVKYKDAEWQNYGLISGGKEKLKTSVSIWSFTLEITQEIKDLRKKDSLPLFFDNFREVIPAGDTDIENVKLSLLDLEKPLPYYFSTSKENKFLVIIKTEKYDDIYIFNSESL